MLTKTPHLFDDATRITAGDSSWQGRAGEDYWAFVGQFGGATAASILRALIQHPERSGDPLALTINFCAPVAQGEFDLDIRLVKANRSSQHWSVEMTGASGGGMVQVTLNGKGEMRRIKIDKSLMTADEVEVLEDLIIAATSDAKNRVDAHLQEEMSKLTGGLNLPPGMKLPF